MRKELFACGGAIFAAASLILLAPTPPKGWAQVSSAANALMQTLKSLYEEGKRNVIESAELLPEADYGFKPTPEVRSFGETLGHIANANYRICARVKGEESPNTANLEKHASKAEFVKALKDSYAYCDGAFEGMTDEKALELIKVGGSEVPRARSLIGLVKHDDHEYGKLVMYLRLKGLVPPSTARRQP
jgi:uncharacterized damage-inducible protein DinB